MDNQRQDCLEEKWTKKKLGFMIMGSIISGLMGNKGAEDWIKSCVTRKILTFTVAWMPIELISVRNALI